MDTVGNTTHMAIISCNNKMLSVSLQSWAQFLKGQLALIQDYNLFHFLYLPSYALPRLTFCVMVSLIRSKGTTVFCKLELHVLRQENPA